MSKNFFAALDDSGDEAPSPVKSEKKAPPPPPTNKKPTKQVAEPSKVDERKRPNNHDRNTKYGRGGRAPVRDGKRAYDRRSGTGRGKEIKKGGGGARNWGSDKNDARQAEGHLDGDAPPTDDSAMEAKDDETRNINNDNGEERTGEAGANNEEEEQQPEEPEPEEDRTMSFEDYMATKANPDNAAFAPVKEREVTNEFAGLKVAPKKKEEEDFLVMSGGKQKKTKQKKGNTKTSITPEFRVASSSGGGGDERRRDGGRGGGRGRGRGGEGRGGREGGGRGGRGGGRGGREGGRDGRGRGGRDGRGRGGRGGGRGGRSDQINVMDESAFPSL